MVRLAEQRLELTYYPYSRIRVPYENRPDCQLHYACTESQCTHSCTHPRRSASADCIRGECGCIGGEANQSGYRATNSPLQVQLSRASRRAVCFKDLCSFLVFSFFFPFLFLVPFLFPLLLLSLFIPLLPLLFQRTHSILAFFFVRSRPSLRAAAASRHKDYTILRLIVDIRGNLNWSGLPF